MFFSIMELHLVDELLGSHSVIESVKRYGVVLTVIGGTCNEFSIHVIRDFKRCPLAADDVEFVNGAGQFAVVVPAL